MKRLLFPACALLILLTGRPGAAQEAPETELEFVRNLRAKGFNDLAKEYLDKLKKNPHPLLQAALPLENARTLVAMARDKEPGQRSGFFAQARVELGIFIKNNAGKPEAAQAQLELARLTSYEGQALLSKALREEDVRSQQEAGKRAEPKLIQAGAELEAARKLLSDMAANYKDADSEREKAVKAQLEKERLQARLERAINYIDQARTYIDLGKEAINEARGKIMLVAKKEFEAIATDEAEAASLLANAWLVKIYQDIQDPTKAATVHAKVMAKTGATAQPARRWAGLFYIQGIMENPNVKLDTQKKLKLIQSEAKSWLTAFPGYHKAPEGWAVQFELAEAMIKDANILTQKDSKNATAATLLVQAQKHLDAIAQSDNDYAERANQYSLGIAFKRIGEEKKLEQITDFNECFLKAQYELLKMREAIGKIDSAKEDQRKALDKARKAHLAQAIKALRKTVSLADVRSPAQKVDEARYFLATSYLVSGDAERASIAGESLGRSRPPTRRAPYGAAYALEAYGNMLGRDDSQAIRDRLKALAEYVLEPEQQKLWATEPVTGVARYQVALMHHRDKNFKEAINQLELLPTDFPGYHYAQGQLVYWIMEARDKAEVKAEKEAYVALARKALARIPALPADADPSTAAMFFQAHTEETRFLYAEAAKDLGNKQVDAAAFKYIQMGKVLDGLKAQYDKTPVKISQATKDRLEFFMEVMRKYAKLGLADVDYRRGSYDKVLNDNAKLIEEVKTKGKAEGAIRMKEYQVVGDFLGLALRANVQKGKIDEAKNLLKLLERLTGEEKDEISQAENVLRSLVEDLQVQVRDLKKAGDTAKLKDVVNNFSTFLDELAKKSDGKTGLALADITFLANCYMSLDQFCKASAIYAKAPTPKALDKDAKAKLDEKEEKEMATYWFVQIQHAKAMRQCGKEKGAREEMEQANKVLGALLRHPHGRLQLLAEKEKIHILEDLALYGSAIKAWGKFMINPDLRGALTNPQLAADTRARLKELYFDAYYHNTWCIFKLSQTEKYKGTPKEKEYLTITGTNILKMERSANREGWEQIGPRCEELIRSEAKLREEYEELKKSTK